MRRTSLPSQEVRPCENHGRADRRGPRQAEAGTPVAEIIRELGVSEATFYAWKKRFGSLGTPEIRELRQLLEENTRLKQVVADLTLGRAILQDVLKKSGEARPAPDSYHSRYL